jgi:hypothetical protein
MSLRRRKKIMRKTILMKERMRFIIMRDLINEYDRCNVNVNNSKLTRIGTQGKGLR